MDQRHNRRKKLFRGPFARLTISLSAAFAVSLLGSTSHSRAVPSGGPTTTLTTSPALGSAPAGDSQAFVASTILVAGVNNFAACDPTQVALSYGLSSSKVVHDFFVAKGWTSTRTTDAKVKWRHYSDSSLTGGWGQDHLNADATNFAYIYSHGWRYDLGGTVEPDIYALIPGELDANFGSCGVAFGPARMNVVKPCVSNAQCVAGNTCACPIPGAGCVKTCLQDLAINQAKFGNTKNRALFLDTCFSLHYEDFKKGWHKNAFGSRNVMTFGYHGLTRDNSGHETLLGQFFAAGWDGGVNKGAGIKWVEKMYRDYRASGNKEECPMVVVRADSDALADSIYNQQGLKTLGDNSTTTKIHKIFYKKGCEPVQGTKLPL
jgi:hypothetical protein